MQQVMPRAIARPRTYPRSIPAPIPLRELWPWTLFGLFLLLLIYFVVGDQGATSLIPGKYVHELVHDGRHLLAFPCH